MKLAATRRVNEALQVAQGNQNGRRWKVVLVRASGPFPIFPSLYNPFSEVHYYIFFSELLLHWIIITPVKDTSTTVGTIWAFDLIILQKHYILSWSIFDAEFVFPRCGLSVT